MAEPQSKTTLSFEEFSAVRRRQRNKGSHGLREEAPKQTPAKAHVKKKGSLGGRLFENLGVGLQRQEFQLFIVMVTFADVAALVAQMYLEPKSKQVEEAGGLVLQSNDLLQLLQYIPVFALFVYTLELILLLFAFGGKIFSHSGYATDCAVFLLVGYGRINGGDSVIRLLNVTRVWRVVRMVNAHISAIEDEYMQGIELLEIEVERLKSLEVELKATKVSLKKEKDKALRMEETFRSQRDQLDTYSEALQIAAKTVAKWQEVNPGSMDLVADAISEAKSAKDEMDSDYEDSRQFGKESMIVIDEDGSYH